MLREMPTEQIAVRLPADLLAALDDKGYTRIPPTPREDAAASASLRDAIIEEPW
jgi:hypothetical protein